MTLLCYLQRTKNDHVFLLNRTARGSKFRLRILTRAELRHSRPAYRRNVGKRRQTLHAQFLAPTIEIDPALQASTSFGSFRLRQALVSAGGARASHGLPLDARGLPNFQAHA